MFCCGTNVVFRRDALREVGGLDESSVTEDFATSLEFHLRGWQSSYMNRVSAFGMGPEDLGGFFKQQFRWALGCVSQVRRIVSRMRANPQALPLNTWWEYLLSATYYLVGWAFLFMVLAPVAYIFCDVPTLFVYPGFYFVFFAPYLLLTLSLFFWTLSRRNYKPAQILSGMVLISITFPVYMRAAVLGLLGVKGRFVVTPKGGSSSLPMRALWPQIALATVCFSAVIWAAHRIVFEREGVLPLVLNATWCAYFGLVLSGMFYFNNPRGVTK
jgi:cellulose synthase (UDP-forming)